MSVTGRMASVTGRMELELGLGPRLVLGPRLGPFGPLSHSLSRNGNGITSPLKFLASEQTVPWSNLL